MAATGCPVHAEFDPLSQAFLADPFAVLRARLALEGLPARWPELELVPGQEIPFHPNISFRGPLELWVSARTSA